MKAGLLICSFTRWYYRARTVSHSLSRLHTTTSNIQLHLSPCEELSPQPCEELSQQRCEELLLLSANQRARWCSSPRCRYLVCIADTVAVVTSSVLWRRWRIVSIATSSVLNGPIRIKERCSISDLGTGTGMTKQSSDSLCDLPLILS